MVVVIDFIRDLPYLKLLDDVRTGAVGAVIGLVLQAIVSGHSTVPTSTTNTLSPSFTPGGAATAANTSVPSSVPATETRPVVATPFRAPAPDDRGCTFVLGLARAVRDFGPDLVGHCVGNERTNPNNGNSEQLTDKGMLVWRVSDGISAFTNGASTWYDYASGVVNRPATDSTTCVAPTSVPVVSPVQQALPPTQTQPISSTAPPSSADVPGSPSSVGAVASPPVASGPWNALVSWTAPATDGGAPITSYRVVWSDAPADKTKSPVTVVASQHQVNIAGLAEANGYQFCVSAINSSGPGQCTGSAMTNQMTGAPVTSIASTPTPPPTKVATAVALPTAAPSLSQPSVVMSNWGWYAGTPGCTGSPSSRISNRTFVLSGFIPNGQWTAQTSGDYYDCTGRFVAQSRQNFFTGPRPLDANGGDSFTETDSLFGTFHSCFLTILDVRHA